MSRGPTPRGPDWSGGILVALSAGEARSVTPLLSTDGRTIELSTTVPLRSGDEVAVQIRCGGPRRLLIETRARVESTGRAEKGVTARLSWVEPGLEELSALASVARDLGLHTGGRASVIPVDETIAVRVGEPVETLLLDLAEGEVGAAVGQLLDGGLMLAAAGAASVGTPVLLRVGLPDAPPFWVSGRIVYQGETPAGEPGVGIAVDALPEPLRRELDTRRAAARADGGRSGRPG